MQKVSAGNTSDVALALGVMAILIVMVIPLPTALLDILLTSSITFGILILLTSLYTVKPLDFSAFPSILLVITLFRLSLNVASTRLILLHGHEGPLAAGKVIKSFGSFVVGGNYVVGFVVFLILVIINYIVITKGATRIAEVAARFTLDAMPGKQMAIDADLNAGLIDDNEARERRDIIRREADFYGAMDGASKFVRGDAIAGVIVTLINIIGGLVIGVTQQKMGLYAAAQNYTLLTIGDGLVSQIPSLIVSTAAGIQVSKASSQGSMGKEFARQFSVEPRAMGVAAGMIFIFGLTPGLPHLPFMFLAIVLGFFAYLARNMKQHALKTAMEKKATPPKGPEPMESILPLDVLELEIGYGLIPLVDERQNGELLERIRAIRRQFALEMGIIVPPIHVRDNLKLKPGQYTVLTKGVEVAKGELMLDHYLAMDPGDAKKKIDGVPTTEPAFGLQALWVPEKKKEEAQLSGYTVVDLPTVVATHLTEVIRSHAHELLGRQDVQKLLDNLAIHHPKVVEELTPSLLSLGAIQKVLQNLLKERVSIRDLLTIVETLADFAPAIKDPDLLTEYVRQRLSRSIVKPYLEEDDTLSVLTVDNSIEEIMSGAIKQTEYGSYLALEPNIARKVLQSTKSAVEKVVSQGLQPVCLCSPFIRRYLRGFIERSIPHLAVLSSSELPDNIRIKTEGAVILEHVD